MPQDEDDAVDCGMTVGLYGRLRPHPWIGAEGGGEGLRERLVDLALSRTDAYDWYAPVGLRMRGGRSAHLVPDRWVLCDQGGDDWSVGEVEGEDGTGPARELLWLRADLARRIESARLPLLPMTRTASDALHRAGDFRLAALRAHLPLNVTAGEAAGDWEDMRDWFSLAAPAPTVTVRCAVAVAGEETVPAAWRAGGTAEEVGAVWQTLLGDAATVRPSAPSTGSGGVRYRPYLDRARPVAAYGCRVREWTADSAVWLLETAGEALRRTGHTVPVQLTATLT